MQEGSKSPPGKSTGSVGKSLLGLEWDGEEGQESRSVLIKLGRNGAGRSYPRCPQSLKRTLPGS
jgi:hypothetical protein